MGKVIVIAIAIVAICLFIAMSPTLALVIMALGIVALFLLTKE